jgi:hypothetical protein
MTLFRNVSYCEALKTLRQLFLKVDTRECERVAIGFDLACFDSSNLNDELYANVLLRQPHSSAR